MFSVLSYFSMNFQMANCYNQPMTVYDQDRRNSCYDDAGRNSCYDKAGLNSCYNKAGRNSYYDEAGRIGILLRILRTELVREGVINIPGCVCVCTSLQDS